MNAGVEANSLQLWYGLASAAKCNEGIVAHLVVAAGLNFLVPPATIKACLSGRDLEKLICGEREIDVELLKVILILFFSPWR
jgi:hypothetical protein